jgi:DNA repair exonuclease SbcCD ATPase subunit
LLEDLMNAQTQMRDAAATIDRIANRVHGSAAALSNLERERLRQQTRANNEAVKADNAAEEITRLRAELATMTERAENAERGFKNLRDGSGVADEIQRWQKAEADLDAALALLRSLLTARGFEYWAATVDAWGMLEKARKP